MAGTRYAVAPDVSAKVIDAEAVIINLSSGVYHSTSGSGALAWALLERGHASDAVATRVAEHFAVDPGTVATDLGPFLGRLVDEGLMTTAPPAQPAAGEVAFPAGSYEAPALETYADMADLLALDPPMPGIQDIPWRAPGDETQP